MSNQSWPGVSSLVLNEPLLWEKGRPGRVGVSLPESDVPAAPYEAEGMVRTDLNLPDLAELDVVRHYTRLSTWNFGVDTGMYPPTLTEEHTSSVRDSASGMERISFSSALVMPFCTRAE